MIGTTHNRTALHRRLMLLTCGAALGLGACSGDGSGDNERTESNSGVGITETDSAGSDSGTGGETSAATPSADTTGGGCPAVQRCGEGEGETPSCCAPSEVCIEGSCEVDCGGPPACGGTQVCCDDAAGEICYGGSCIVPGGACSGAACATTTEPECADGEICDATLGQCVPNLADESCAFAPEVGVFDPVPRFTWGFRQQRSCDLGCQTQENCVADICTPTWPHIEPQADDMPDSYQCVMSPMVVDIDLDCVPEIIFNTYPNSSYTQNGTLRAIRGDDGSKVFTVTDPNAQTDPGATPAVGDINGDGIPEIIAPGEGSNLIAFTNTGAVLWTSENYSGGGKSGSPSLADFDGDGVPEIAFGRNIFDNTGALAWSLASGPTGANGSVGPLSCVADLNGDNLPELILGGTVYTFSGTVAGGDFTGTLLWEGEQVDGYCGIADFTGDGQPEVANVRSGSIYIYDGLTGVTLGSLVIPGGGAGGPPNIADFDGDGTADIGTAGGNAYVVAVFDEVGGMTELWQADTKDGSSQRTGSSVFDFDGDGRSEVIYGDEWYLRIYPGTEPDCDVGGPNCDGIMTDAEVLFSDINSSRTRSEYPIVADVDGDFKAEIIISTNNESGQGAIGDAGIEVFEDRLDNWVGTLPIWNQHTYHVTNVEVDGTIPSPEPPNWATPAAAPHNSYRRNSQGSLDSLCAPDLTPVDLEVPSLPCPNLEMSVRVLNQGCLGVGPGVDVAFYEGGDTLLGVVQTQNAIPAGGSETVTLSLQDPGGAPFSITVVVDDDGMMVGALNECIEDNNTTEPIEVCEGIG